MSALRAVCCVWILMRWGAAYPQGVLSDARAPRRPHWSERLKDIPVGPFRLDIGGSARFRYEHTSDFNIQRYSDDREEEFESGDFLIHRERLELNLRFNDRARFFVQLQNNDVFNSDFRDDDFFQSQPFTNSLDIRQAYLDCLHFADSPFGFRIGRQAIFYGDNRIWGPGEWGNTGRFTWDAAKFIIDLPVAETHLIFGNRIRHDPHSFDEHDPDLDAYGLYSMFKGLPVKFDLFWLSKRTRPDMTVNRKGDTVELDTDTFGFYLDRKQDVGWDWGGTVAYTIGERSATTFEADGGELDSVSTRDDVRAYGYNARLGYTFDHPFSPRFGTQFTFGSGDSDPTPNGRYETFDGAFGAVDMPYGRMNLFSWMNIQDYELNFSIKPSEKMKISLDHHFFRLEEAKDAWYYFNGQTQRSDPTGRAGSDVGRELDLILTYNPSEWMELQIGYAHFWPGEFVRHTGPSPDADWFFAQLIYSF